MPSKTAHLLAAKKNADTIAYLKERFEDFPEWVVTVAFYRALHIVEAVFYDDDESSVDHTDQHSTRNRHLKQTRRYQNLWRHYRPLYNDSMVARYLQGHADDDIVEVFSSYLSTKDIEDKHLNHNLRQVERTAKTLLGDPDLFADPRSDGVDQ